MRQEVPARRGRVWLLILAEAVLVVVIVGLIIATWLPAFYGESDEEAAAGETATAASE